MTPPGGSGVARRDARELQREAVADHHVAVLPAEAGRPVARRRIEQRLRRQAAEASTARGPRRRRSARCPAGCVFANAATCRVKSAGSFVLRRSSAEKVETAHRHVRVAVDEARDDAPPLPVDDDGLRALRASRSRRSCPTATMRPSRTASACASGRAGSPVQIFAETRTRSAGGPSSPGRASRRQIAAAPATAHAVDEMPTLCSGERGARRGEARDRQRGTASTRRSRDRRRGRTRSSAGRRRARRRRRPSASGFDLAAAAACRSRRARPRRTGRGSRTGSSGRIPSAM